MVQQFVNYSRHSIIFDVLYPITEANVEVKRLKYPLKSRDRDVLEEHHDTLESKKNGIYFRTKFKR
jgi:hypothetical protein